MDQSHRPREHSKPLRVDSGIGEDLGRREYLVELLERHAQGSEQTVVADAEVGTQTCVVGEGVVVQPLDDTDCMTQH